MKAERKRIFTSQTMTDYMDHKYPHILKRFLFLISNNVNETEERCHVNNKIAVLLP